MERIFLTVLNMSITSGYVILAVLAARFVIRRAPKKYSYLLWSVVGFRLICPVSFNSVFSLFRLRLFDLSAAQRSGANTLSYIPENIGLMTSPQVATGIPAVNEVINHSLPAATMHTSVNPMQIWIAAGAFIWMAGMAVMLLYSLIGYGMLRYRMRNAILFKKNVYQSDQVRSPFILGFVRPKIYIPFGLEERMQQYVLLHERYHLKRKDHLVKLAAFLLLTLHWFNPLCWLAFALMGKDMEMSCDERVLQEGKNIRKLYSTALLSFAANRRFPAPGPLAFGETGVKERIKNVLHWKKPKLYLTALAVSACCIVVAACAANPAGQNAEEETETAAVADGQEEAGQEEAEQEASAVPEAANQPQDDETPGEPSTLPDGQQDAIPPADPEALLVETQDGLIELRVGNVVTWELSDADSLRNGILLDADGDGTMERVYLTIDQNQRLENLQQEFGHYVLENGFFIHVGDQELEQYGDYVECSIMALTLGEKQLLLGIFDEGPSGDPVTRFYRYDGTGLYAAGSIPEDIRTLPVGEVIPCPFRADMIQTAFATGYWYYNGEEVVMREDAEYYYVHYEGEEEFPLTLLEELLVYPQPGDVGEPAVMTPQPVREVKTDLKEGLYLQAQDGTEGWIRARPSYLPSLGDKQSAEVFDGLQFYD